MIQPVESLPGEGMTLRTVSHQGAHLSASQRRTLALRQQVQASFMNTHLTAMVNDALAKSETAKPERIWFVDRTEKGTPFVGDAFGF